MSRSCRWAAMFVLALIALGSVSAHRADAGFILQSAAYNGHNYYLVAENSARQRTTWASAEAYAVSLGGHLATVNDAAENNFLLTTFQASAAAAKAAAHPSGGLLSMWIGYNDVASEGSFVWVGGGGTGYTNWAPTQPQGDSADEDYAAILATSDFRPAGLWHDVVSDFRINDVTYGLVEVTVARPTPAPATVALLAAGAAGLAGWGRRRRAPRPEGAAAPGAGRA